MTCATRRMAFAVETHPRLCPFSLTIGDQHHRRGRRIGRRARARIGGNVWRLGRICRGLRRGRPGRARRWWQRRDFWRWPRGSSRRRWPAWRHTQQQRNPQQRRLSSWLAPSWAGVLPTGRSLAQPAYTRRIRRHHEAVSTPAARRPTGRTGVAAEPPAGAAAADWARAQAALPRARSSPRPAAAAPLAPSPAPALRASAASCAASGPGRP